MNLRRVKSPQDVDDRKSEVPHGICLHTTGSGLPTTAAERHMDPLALAERIYTAKGANFPHYTIDWAGTILQVADDRERARHAGIDKAERKAYSSGEWVNAVSQRALKLWRQKWPDAESPLDLIPGGGSPNDAFLGIELVPLIGAELKANPNGTRFTEAQYDALAELLRVKELEYGLVLDTGSNLVGHCDLEPLTRWSAGPRGLPWDPGALRPEGDRHFEWDFVVARLQLLRG